MLFLRTYRRAVSAALLLVILTGWFVLPLGTWVPKLAGWEHMVSVGLDHSDLHLAIIHADGSVDHRNHGPNCPGHPVPKGTHDHNKHGFHMPHMERELAIGIPVPLPVIAIAPLLYPLDDQFHAELCALPEHLAADWSPPPIELRKSTVLLI